jgi:hypothetical protein
MPKQASTCKHEGCSRAADGGKNYCARHYAAWRRGALPKGRYKTCRVEGCRKRMVARGRCEEHFTRDHPGKSAPQGAEAPAPPPSE